MHRLEMDISLQFDSDWHSGSGEGGLLVDRLIRRDSGNRPYVPASTLRGVVREQYERLSRLYGLPEPSDPHSSDSNRFVPADEIESPADLLFGTKHVESTLFFRDARSTIDIPFSTQDRSRTAMYRVLRTAKDKHLFQTEYTRPVRLDTKVSAFHADLGAMDEDQLPYAYCLLVFALLSVERIGGDKSTGKGNCRLSITRLTHNGREYGAEEIMAQLEDMGLCCELYAEAEEL